MAFPQPTISEDTLFYTLHLPSPSPFPPAPALATLITSHIHALLAPSSPSGRGEDWLWHKDPWELLPASKDKSLISEFGEEEGVGERLEGKMRVGDSVDDEWLVVWLLWEVSKKWGELVISIRDTDGEFLLIESASHLPSWLSPENSHNRFWLSSGQFYLLPPSPSSPPGPLTLPQALPMVLSRSHPAPAEMQFVLKRRIETYPAALGTHHITVAVYLPREIVRVVRGQGGERMVGRAVEGFYTRDPAQLRSASKITHFPPTPSNTLLTPLHLTRTSYAQLLGQNFHPPKPFGPEWRIPTTPLLSTPSDSRAQAERERETERKRRDLGVKVVVGFEIMYKESPPPRRPVVGAKGGEEEDVTKQEGYSEYLGNLKKAGWFEEEMEGSKRWREREAEAVAGWKRVRGGESEERISFGQTVQSALLPPLSAPDSGADDLAAYTVPPSFEDGDDSWLQVDEGELNAILAGAEAGAGDVEMRDAAQEGEEGKEGGKGLGELARKVRAFVEGRGDMEGARFDDELSDEEMLGDSDDESENEEEDEEAERERRLKELVPPLAEGEWGRKPDIPSSAKKPETTKVGLSDLVLDKTVSFAEPPKPTSDIPGIRAPLLAPEEFDGHIIDSDDESSEDEGVGESGYAGQSSYKLQGEKSRKKGEMSEIDRNIKELADEFDRETKMDLPASERRKNSKPVGAMGRTGPLQAMDGDEEAGEGGEDGEVDMEGEEEEFLRFAREALGIDEMMWEGMMDERKARGAYVPSPKSQTTSTPSKPLPKSAAVSETPEDSSSDDAMDIETDRPIAFDPYRQSNITDIRFGSVAPATPFAPTQSGKGKEKAKLAEGERDPQLNSFEKVMEAMDRELVKKKGGAGGQKKEEKPGATATEKPAPKSSKPGSLPPLPKLPTEADLEAMDHDDLLAMDRELKAALKSAGIDDVDSDEEGEDDEEMKAAYGALRGGEKEEYKMMKDFLESYKSQGGGSGVVGNLFGRLGEGK